MSARFPTPVGGASLIVSLRLQNKTTLIIGSGALAASRAFAALEADSEVIVLAHGGVDSLCDELQWRVQQQQIQFADWDHLPSSSESTGDADRLDAFLQSTGNIALAIITDTLSSSHRRSHVSAQQLYTVFKARHIPVNTTDVISLCDFSFTASHRFEHHVSGEKSALQVGVTTNGKGCRLAGRLRREIVAKLPKEVAAAVENVGRLRDMAKEKSGDESVNVNGSGSGSAEEDEEICEDGGASTPNRPVPARSSSESAAEARARRIKWVAQVSEYWPISRLAAMSDEDAKEVLAGTSTALPSTPIPDGTVTSTTPSQHFGTLPKPGRILLLGSGPGHPSLLTMATHAALTEHADLVLSDKLVPDAVLAIIPKHVQVRIARKFPGNAEASQTEMMEAAIEAANKGLTVVRLKQGDPVVYGRAGEEVLYFRERGYEPLVIPGVSSALAAPTFAGIPVTQRGAAESFMVCTGVGRRGKEVQLPGYERARTLVVLMGVARLPQVISALVDISTNEGGRRVGAAYPPHMPIAIIERASMPDQRVVASTLKDIVRALDSSGEQRPPGMMVIGWSVLALHGKGDVGVLEDGAEAGDEARVQRWLGTDSAVGWRVWEGLDAGWEIF
ncbi:hypothetical protein D9619_002485 [Psilocybe cf. subviscida]|uniref:precorrin-2 dehydrogenase n=1 Tax=Psilocybe cf. subviscida TaxID=2480587 RepID=A0A8H5AXK5_9AGAR|nr:hypothetical protein D9619_002485 [Psilocybe cf. subviscida]